MRDIRFRAWLKDYEAMVYSDNQASLDFCEIWKIDETISVEVQETYWSAPGGEPEENCHYVKVDADIMQYIGEHDENGNDIYESDIVDVCVFLVSPENPDNDQHFRGWISFERGCFMLNITHYKDYSKKGELVPLQARHLPFYEPELEEDGSFAISLYDFMGISGNLGEFISDNIEVVGNVHEQDKNTNNEQQQ